LIVAGPGGPLEAAVWHSTRVGKASIVASLPWTGARIRWVRLYVGRRMIGNWSR